MKNILFVCTGNTCRSSMAKGIMENAISKDSQLNNKITVDSSGISARPNDSASTNSITVLKEDFGIDISSHKAKLFDLNTALKAHLILTMTKSHKNIICDKYPELSSKTFTLKEYIISRNLNDSSGSSLSGSDISDPYGMPVNMYRQCAFEINNAIDILVRILKNESNE